MIVAIIVPVIAIATDAAMIIAQEEEEVVVVIGGSRIAPTTATVHARVVPLAALDETMTVEATPGTSVERTDMCQEGTETAAQI